MRNVAQTLRNNDVGKTEIINQVESLSISEERLGFTFFSISFSISLLSDFDFCKQFFWYRFCGCHLSCTLWFKHFLTLDTFTTNQNKTKQKMSKPIVGYWDIRGLAQSIRHMLKYLKVDFEDRRYVDRQVWFDKKFDMGFDFPNVSFSGCFSIDFD